MSVRKSDCRGRLGGGEERCKGGKGRKGEAEGLWVGKCLRGKKITEV